MPLPAVSQREWKQPEILVKLLLCSGEKQVIQILLNKRKCAAKPGARDKCTGHKRLPPGDVLPSADMPSTSSGKFSWRHLGLSERARRAGEVEEAHLTLWAMGRFCP